MRVISGKYRGKKLHTLKSEIIRPTSDKVKESLFNIIQDRVCGSVVLDLFAGSGAISIEAISRGATYATLVEKNFKSIKIIKKNIESLNLQNSKEQFNIIKSDVENHINNEKQSYDIIFLDPPYDYAKNEIVLKKIYENNLLNDDGIIIFETDRDYEFNAIDFKIMKDKIYSKTKLTFLIK